MAKEINEGACFLDVPNGLGKGSNYLQKFVKASPQGNGPCNYAAEKADLNDPSLRISMGK